MGRFSKKQKASQVVHVFVERSTEDDDGVLESDFEEAYTQVRNTLQVTFPNVLVYENPGRLYNVLEKTGLHSSQYPRRGAFEISYRVGQENDLTGITTVFSRLESGTFPFPDHVAKSLQLFVKGPSQSAPNPRPPTAPRSLSMAGMGSGRKQGVGALRSTVSAPGYRKLQSRSGPYTSGSFGSKESLKSNGKSPRESRPVSGKSRITKQASGKQAVKAASVESDTVHISEQSSDVPHNTPIDSPNRIALGNDSNLDVERQVQRSSPSAVDSAHAAGASERADDSENQETLPQEFRPEEFQSASFDQRPVTSDGSLRPGVRGSKAKQPSENRLGALFPLGSMSLNGAHRSSRSKMKLRPSSAIVPRLNLGSIKPAPDSRISEREANSTVLRENAAKLGQTTPRIRSGLHGIVTDLRRGMSSASAVAAACNTVQTLAMHPGVRLELADAGAGSAVLSCLSNLSGNDSAAIAVCGAVASLARCGAGRTSIVESGGIAEIVFLLEQRWESPAVFAACIQALQYMCCPDDEEPLALRLMSGSATGFDEAKIALMDSPGLLTLCEMVIRWKDFPEQATDAMHLLSLLTVRTSDKTSASILSRIVRTSLCDRLESVWNDESCPERLAQDAQDLSLRVNGR